MCGSKFWFETSCDDPGTEDEALNAVGAANFEDRAGRAQRPPESIRRFGATAVFFSERNMMVNYFEWAPEETAEFLRRRERFFKILYDTLKEEEERSENWCLSASIARLARELLSTALAGRNVIGAVWQRWEGGQAMGAAASFVRDLRECFFVRGIDCVVHGPANRLTKRSKKERDPPIIVPGPAEWHAILTNSLSPPVGGDGTAVYVYLKKTPILGPIKQ